MPGSSRGGSAVGSMSNLRRTPSLTRTKGSSRSTNFLVWGPMGRKCDMAVRRSFSTSSSHTDFKMGGPWDLCRGGRGFGKFLLILDRVFSDVIGPVRTNQKRTHFAGIFAGIGILLIWVTSKVALCW